MSDDPKHIIDRVKRDSTVIGESAIAKTGKQNQPEIDPNDPIEILGRKIGRTLGWIGVVVLVILLAQDLIPHFSRYF